jgi:hypothetical protein
MTNDQRRWSEAEARWLLEKEEAFFEETDEEEQEEEWEPTHEYYPTAF